MRQKEVDKILGFTADVRVSFEFFPPKSEKMERALWHSVERLAPLGPSFVSVTYGAGGTTREKTHDIVARLQSETGIPAAAHLTCVGASTDQIHDIAQRYWDAGIRHIVALRGDPPDGHPVYQPAPHGYPYAADLVRGLKSIADFEISVAAYPETHPEAASLDADLDNLKRKIDEGAGRAITQFFFDPGVYFKFRDRAAASGITIPIVPGILPVTNFAQVTSFSKLCGTLVPVWMAELFYDLDEDPETRQLVAASVAIELSRVLVSEGVEDIHFYTLNRADLTYAICHVLGLRPNQLKK